MATTIILDEAHIETAAKKAKELGKTTEGYIEFLIDAASGTFDDILEPVRASFRSGGTSEDELDDAVTQARIAIRKDAGK
jgi:hypothetical protein